MNEREFEARRLADMEREYDRMEPDEVPTEELIDYVRDQLTFFERSNDRSSPTHHSDAQEYLRGFTGQIDERVYEHLEEGMRHIIAALMMHDRQPD